MDFGERKGTLRIWQGFETTLRIWQGFETTLRIWQGTGMGKHSTDSAIASTVEPPDVGNFKQSGKSTFLNKIKSN